MLERLRGTLTFANVTSVLALVFAMSGGAYAITSTPASGRVIHGCYQRRTGNLRVIAAGKKCRKTERSIAWNQKGQAGPQGLPGRQGAQGPQGQKGDVGATGPATGPAGGDLTGTYPDPRLAPGAVTANGLADGSVSTAKFASGAKAPDASELGGVVPTPTAITPALLNGWVPYGSGYDRPAYWMDALGVVHLKGSVRQSPAGSDVIFILPVGMRPSESTNWPATLDSATFGTIEIETNGDVRSRTFSSAQATAAQAFTSLEGVSFRPSDP